MKTKTVYSKPGIVFFDFKTNAVCGTPELKEKIFQQMAEFSDKADNSDECYCILVQPTLEQIN